LLVLSRLTGSLWLLGVISIVGGVVVMHMGYAGLRRGAGDTASVSQPSRSLRKGVIVNLLSPHPYIFWLSVGGPITVRAAESNLSFAVTFVSLFYVLLIGSKVVVAWIAAKSRPFLRGRTYDLTVRGLGVLLCLFALVLIREGVSMIGWF
jgi:threonine/homoserine/homoserine lactone efflux protein